MSKTTVVLVHGAFADASSWNGVIERLQSAPDEGEALGEVEAGSKDSVLNSALVPRRYPTENGGSANEFYIDPTAHAGRSCHAGRPDCSENASSETGRWMAAIRAACSSERSPANASRAFRGGRRSARASRDGRR
jgi:hypothetical protein